MKRILVITAALVALAASSAFAQHTLDYAWNNCAGEGGVQNITLAGCVAGSPLNKSYGSLNVGPTISGVVSTDLFIDLEVSDPGLPTFWRFKTSITPAECNDGLSISAVHEPDFNGLICTTARNMWGDVFYGDVSNGSELAGFALGYVPNIGGAANRGRIVGSLFRLSGNPIDLTGGKWFVVLVQYNAIRSDQRTPPGPCSGCAIPTAIVWNQCNVGSLAAVNGPEAITEVTQPGPFGQCISTGGANTLCGATPTQNKTWGALKSLYR